MRTAQNGPSSLQTGAETFKGADVSSGATRALARRVLTAKARPVIGTRALAGKPRGGAMNGRLAHLGVYVVVAIFGATLGGPPLAWAQAEHVYFGNLHSHTSYSDGSGLPEEAYKHARDAGLDFLFITEHNHRLAEQG